MCGIAGIFAKHGDRPAPEDLARMTAVLSHRGPDDEGSFIEGPFALGHLRLAIIDLSPSGRQPMFNETKRFALTANGEIYNYRALMDELKGLGHTFISKSDSEVLVHGFEEWGEGMLDRLRGMYAFAIADLEERSLFLATDPFGIKPLYYTETGGLFLFASEIKGLAAHPAFSPELDPLALADFITFQNVLDEKTLFKGVKRLMPGHLLRVSGNGSRPNRYFFYRFEKRNNETYPGVLERFRALFNRSVERHMVSDVAVGSYLSGGFDSTSVAALASRLASPFSTFHGTFGEGARYREVAAARAVADKIGSRHFETLITWQDFRDRIRDVVYHLDEPSVGCGALPQFMVSKLVSEHVKVVLTGHGGDELFFGYQTYKAARYKRLLAQNPIEGLARLVKGLGRGDMLRTLYFLLFPLLDSSVGHGLFIMFDKKQRQKLFSRDFLDTIKGHDPLAALRELTNGVNFVEPTDRIAYLYLTTYLRTLLMQEDKVGMAHSVEARIPFLDLDLVNFSLATRASLKLTGERLKAVVKDSMRELLPPQVYTQPKMGFPVPIALWFRGPLKGLVEDLLLGPRIKVRGIFNMDYLKSRIRKFMAGSGQGLYHYTEANRIYSLITVELWFRLFIDGEAGLG